MGAASSESQSNSTTNEVEVIQINQWDPSAVKNAIDDAAKIVAAEKFKFREVFCLMNMRLGISALSVAFAAYAMVYDYVEPFPKSKHVLATCSIVYFLLMGVFTLFAIFVEKNTFYEGEDTQTVVGKPAKLEMSSAFKKYQNIFEFGIKLQHDGQVQETNFEFPVEDFFTEDGVLLKEKLDNLLAKKFASIESVRKSEGKKVN